MGEHVAQQRKLIQTHAPATTVTAPHYEFRIPLLRLRAHCRALESFLLPDKFGRQKRQPLHHRCANKFNNGIPSTKTNPETGCVPIFFFLAPFFSIPQQS